MIAGGKDEGWVELGDAERQDHHGYQIPGAPGDGLRAQVELRKKGCGQKQWASRIRRGLMREFTSAGFCFLSENAVRSPLSVASQTEGRR